MKLVRAGISVVPTSSSSSSFFFFFFFFFKLSLSGFEDNVKTTDEYRTKPHTQATGNHLQFLHAAVSK